MAIQWRAGMEVDRGVIDQDHRTLIAIINAFGEAPATPEGLPVLADTLGQLERYSKIHFAREERLQRAVQYAYADAHHQEHQALVRRLSAMRDELDALGATPEAAAVAQVHARLSELLHQWLTDHVIGSDLRMKPHAAHMAREAQAMKPLARRRVAWVGG